MALRRILVSLGLLAAIAAAVLLLLPSRAQPKLPTQRTRDNALPGRSFSFTYASHSYLNSTWPGAKTDGPGLTIACESKGFMHLTTREVGELSFLFEFTDVLCGEANVIDERGLARTAQFTREFLASSEAVQRATEDPALAIARSLFLHVDGGLRATWPDPDQVLVNRERRLEGEVAPEIHYSREAGAIRWTKGFSGSVGSDNAAAGLTQSLTYQVQATSQLAQPIEMGLLELQGTEQSMSLQKKTLLARTDIQIHIRRIASIEADRLQTLLTDTKANAPSAAPKMITVEEKQQIIARWRQFRDGDGQKPALGESEANQLEYLELKQALRQDPGLAEDLADDLSDMDVDSSAFATLAGAFIYSGAAQALDAFVEQALAHKDQAEWQERALPMVGLAPGPTSQSWKYLDTMRQQSTRPELATAAELGMATHLKRGYQDSTFVTEIKTRMETALTEADRLHLLDVVGNAGLQQFFPIVLSWSQGASLPLRLRIAQALRFMSLPEAETLLLQMAADPELDLSLMALQCLRDRTVAPGSLPVLLQLLRSAKDDRIRLKVLENLYEARQLDASLLQKIHSVRQSIKVSPALAEAWDQIEKDWVDPVES